VSASSEGDQGSGSRWLNDGKHGGAVAAKGSKEEKGSLHGGDVYFVAGGGGWQRRRELRVERWRCRSCWHCKVVAAVVQTRSARAAPLFR
jgi:hypothetical protein